LCSDFFKLFFHVLVTPYSVLAKIQTMLEKLKLLDPLTNQEYHAHDAVSKSRLDVIDRSPAHYHYQYISGEYERTSSKTFDIGSAAHKLILEPHEFAKEFVAVPKTAPKRPSVTQLNAAKPAPATKTAIAWWAEFGAKNAGKTQISAEDMAEITAIYDSVYRHKAANWLLKEGIAESSIFFTEPETNIQCKARPDFFNSDSFIVDVKTTVNASPNAFGWSALKYRYHVQAAFYMDAFYHAFGEYPAGFVFIAIEKEPPYAVATYMTTPDMLERGGAAYMRNLQTLRRCLDTGEWPAYGELVTDLRFPNQKLQNNEDNF
jgi:exodeoxyribonuclease VIII